MGRGHDDGPGAESWRPVVAALANAEQRLLLAEAISEEARRDGTTIAPGRRDAGLARMADAGLLSQDDDGSWRVDTASLRTLLSTPAAGKPGASGEDVIDRFVRDGRIHTYPAKPGPRHELLRWAARQTLSDGEVLTEPGITARLERITDDPVALRRYLVDAGLVSRSPDGSDYRSTGDGADGPAAAAARAAGLEVTVTRHGPVGSLAEAAAARGIDPRDLLKTLVVRRSDDDYLLVLVPGDRTFSWPKLRALLGTNRLSMPDAAEAQGVTGYARGTITPFGAARPLPVYADAQVAGHTVSLGGGAPGVGLTVDADEALRVLGATVADLSDPPGA